MLDMLIERITRQLSSLRGYRMNIARGCGRGNGSDDNVSRISWGSRDSGVALSLGAEPITPLIDSGLSSSKNIQPCVYFSNIPRRFYRAFVVSVKSIQHMHA
jgi:hypothetical protein